MSQFHCRMGLATFTFSPYFSCSQHHLHCSLELNPWPFDALSRQNLLIQVDPQSHKEQNNVTRTIARSHQYRTLSITNIKTQCTSQRMTARFQCLGSLVVLQGTTFHEFVDQGDKQSHPKCFNSHCWRCIRCPNAERHREQRSLGHCRRHSPSHQISKRIQNILNIPLKRHSIKLLSSFSSREQVY